VRNYVSVELFKWSLPETIPDSWTGTDDYGIPGNLFASGMYEQVVQDWYANRTLPNAYLSACEGTCTSTVGDQCPVSPRNNIQICMCNITLLPQSTYTLT
jgi:hypothetical protein